MPHHTVGLPSVTVVVVCWKVFFPKHSGDVDRITNRLGRTDFAEPTALEPAGLLHEVALVRRRVEGPRGPKVRPILLAEGFETRSRESSLWGAWEEGATAHMEDNRKRLRDPAFKR